MPNGLRSGSTTLFLVNPMGRRKFLRQITGYRLQHFFLNTTRSRMLSSLSLLGPNTPRRIAVVGAGTQQASLLFAPNCQRGRFHEPILANVPKLPPIAKAAWSRGPHNGHRPGPPPALPPRLLFKAGDHLPRGGGGFLLSSLTPPGGGGGMAPTGHPPSGGTYNGSG